MSKEIGDFSFGLLMLYWSSQEFSCPKNDQTLFGEKENFQTGLII